MNARSTFVGLVVLLTATASLAGPAGSTSAPRPVLKIVTAAPLTLRGSYFKAGEHVKVTRVLGGVRVVRSVTASSAGVFVIRYGPAAVFDRCEGNLYVVAIGDKGSRAVAKWLPQPVCLAAGSRG